MPIKKFTKGKTRKSGEDKRADSVEALKRYGDMEVSPEDLHHLPVEVRREEIWKLRNLGHSAKVIQELFAIGKTTYYKDIHAIEQTLCSRLAKTGMAGVVAKSYYFLDSLRDDAAMLFHGLDVETTPLSDRLAALRMIKDLEESKIRMLSFVGALPKARAEDYNDVIREGQGDGSILDMAATIRDAAAHLDSLNDG